MEKEIKTEMIDDLPNNRLLTRTVMPKEVIVGYIAHAVPQEIISQVSKVIADYIIEKHFDEILQKVSPEAIANMAIAEAGAAVNETLHKKMPDKIVEIEKRSTEVYQRGLLGGLKRIK